MQIQTGAAVIDDIWKKLQSQQKHAIRIIFHENKLLELSFTKTNLHINESFP